MLHRHAPLPSLPTPFPHTRVSPFSTFPPPKRQGGKRWGGRVQAADLTL